MKCLLFPLLVLVPPQDNGAKKERIGEILREMAQARKDSEGDKAKESAALERLRPLREEMQRLILELAGPERDRQSALFEELMEKYIPEEAAAQKTASNERRAQATLMHINSAQAEFRGNDPDGDGAHSYWVCDISALYRLRKKNGKAAMLIEDRMADADARPAVPLGEEGSPDGVADVHLLRGGASKPFAGYFLVALESYEEGSGRAAKYDDGSGRNPARFGICAFPADYGKSGKRTFIRSEASKPLMWSKDTGGSPPDTFPADPARAGWTPVN